MVGRRLVMKEYNLYVPLLAKNGTGKAIRTWRWLEELLKAKFGEIHSATAMHEGITAGFAYQGKVRSFSVCAEETKARPFFKHLKQQIKQQRQTEVLILEKDAPGRQGELAGERI
jgi:hypothetical protein